MTRQKAIEAGWRPINHYQPKSFLGGPYTMWESPDGSYQLFCLPYRDAQQDKIPEQESYIKRLNSGWRGDM